MSYRAAQVAWAVKVAVRLMCAPVVVGEDVGAVRARMPSEKIRIFRCFNERWAMVRATPDNAVSHGI